MWFRALQSRQLDPGDAVDPAKINPNKALKYDGNPVPPQWKTAKDAARIDSYAFGWGLYQTFCTDYGHGWNYYRGVMPDGDEKNRVAWACSKIRIRNAHQPSITKHRI